MRRVVIESPFAPKGRTPITRWLDGWKKRRYLRACMRDCLLRGEAPYASHALYTQPGVLRDEVPEERNYGIGAGFAWRRGADATVVYLDLGRSTGMDYGIKDAKLAHHPIEYRFIGWGPYASTKNLLRVSFLSFWGKTKGFFSL